MAAKDKTKTFLGMPMDWDTKNPFKNIWNKQSDKIILPKALGIGWTINFHALGKKIGLIKPGRASADQKRLANRRPTD